MAIPTDFKGPTPAAGTTKTFKLFGSTTVGIWAMDIDGTLSATFSQTPLGPNLAIVANATYTDAALYQALKDFLQAAGQLPGAAGTGGAGGKPADAGKQALVTAQTTA